MSILSTIQVKNFKAIRDSGSLKIKPFTVLIGNNGSGKSSLLEAMATYQAIVRDGVDAACSPGRDSNMGVFTHRRVMPLKL